MAAFHRTPLGDEVQRHLVLIGTLVEHIRCELSAMADGGPLRQASLQPVSVADLQQPTVLRLPAVERLLAYSMRTARFACIEVRLGLLQNPHNLFFYVPVLLQLFSLPAPNLWILLPENAHQLWTDRTRAAQNS